MHVTEPARDDSSPGVVLLRFRYDRFLDAMRRLGHTTDVKRARAAGVGKATIHRWRTQPISQTPLGAHRVATATGLGVDQLFEPIRPQQLAA